MTDDRRPANSELPLILAATKNSQLSRKVINAFEPHGYKVPAARYQEIPAEVWGQEHLQDIHLLQAAIDRLRRKLNNGGSTDYSQ